jgi:multiple sugar transport system permease protein
MYFTRHGKLLGLLYLAPALAFVIAFTAFPVVQMLWMSLHNWSLIEPPKWVGFANYLRAYKDSQFWTSLRFTLTYTLYITPILMVGGFLIALLVVQNTNLRRFTRAVVFVPVVIGLGASSLLWYYLFSYDFGMVNRIALDLGIVRKPVVWFGENVDRSLWAVIASIVWKVIGFGMLLFVAAIQAIPGEINEAAVVDGASYWQRVRRITLPLTARTILLVTLFSVIGSLLAFDQFYLMTAGQPFNKTATSVFFVYLNSFPYLKLGYGAALSTILAIIVLTCTVAQLMLSRRSFG